MSNPDLKGLLFNGDGVMKGLFLWFVRLLPVVVFVWMKAEFVTQSQYDKDQEKKLDQLVEIAKTQQKISDTLEHGAKTDTDHEQRLRELERPKR